MNYYAEEEMNDIRKRIIQFADDENLRFEENELPFVVGEKLSALIYRDARNTHPNLAAGYLYAPPHLFYTDQSGSAIRRVYGMAINSDGVMVAHAVSAMSLLNNDVLGGVPLANLIPVKNWSEWQLQKLRDGLIPDADAFLHPAGFTAFLN